jgi:hypothetical protein
MLFLGEGRSESVLGFINDGEVPVKTGSDVSENKHHQEHTHFSLIGTTMYFFENISTLDVHFFTLWYPSSRLRGNQCKFRVINMKPERLAFSYCSASCRRKN